MVIASDLGLWKNLTPQASDKQSFLDSVSNRVTGVLAELFLESSDLSEQAHQHNVGKQELRETMMRSLNAAVESSATGITTFIANERNPRTSFVSTLLKKADPKDGHTVDQEQIEEMLDSLQGATFSGKVQVKGNAVPVGSLIFTNSKRLPAENYLHDYFYLSTDDDQKKLIHRQVTTATDDQKQKETYTHFDLLSDDHWFVDLLFEKVKS